MMMMMIREEDDDQEWEAAKFYSFPIILSQGRLRVDYKEYD